MVWIKLIGGLACVLPATSVWGQKASEWTSPTAATVEAAALEPDTPEISQSGRTFLSRLARRTIRDASLARPMYEPDYVPASLASLQAEVVVRVRRSGYLLGAAVGGPGPVALATRDASVGAYKVMEQGKLDAGDSGLALIEIEVVGPPVPVPFQGDWTRARAVDALIEPGVDGMVLVGPSGTHRFCPTELFTSDVTLADALKRLARSTQSHPGEITKTQLMRFRSAHWYEPGFGAEIVSLHRGLSLVSLQDVTQRKLDQTIDRLAEYMAYRQKPTGLFSYQYEPAIDRYSDDDNLVRQVGAALAMAMHARWSGKSASLGAADLAIRFHLQGLRDIPDVDNAAYIATANRKNKLGVTALLCLVLAEHPEATRFADTREKLVNGMLWLQQPSGMFITAFPPAESLRAQDYFPGEALLALAVHYGHHPSGKIADSFDRAIGFYRGFFRGGPSPAFVPWQTQAYALMAKHGKRQDYVDYVFELTDWLADKQLGPDNCPWPELWGGIAAYQPGRVGVSTAAYLEGFVDALLLARRRGDRERIDRYESMVRQAARFVMQLEFKPEEAYFVRSRRDALGGIRTTPTLNLLRIDHVQHALIALMKTRRALFGAKE